MDSSILKYYYLTSVYCQAWYTHFNRAADKSLARPGKKQAKISVRIAWISFGDLLCVKKIFMTTRVSILLKSRVSLTCFGACFSTGRAKDLSAPWYFFFLEIQNDFFVPNKWEGAFTHKKCVEEQSPLKCL